MPLSKVKQAEYMREHRERLKSVRYNVIPKLQPKYQSSNPKIAELQAMIHRIEGGSVNTEEIIPWYNRFKNKAGDKVRMRDGSGKVQIVIVPELDAEGNYE